MPNPSIFHSPHFDLKVPVPQPPKHCQYYSHAATRLGWCCICPLAHVHPLWICQTHEIKSTSRHSGGLAPAGGASNNLSLRPDLSPVKASAGSRGLPGTAPRASSMARRASRETGNLVRHCHLGSLLALGRVGWGHNYCFTGGKKAGVQVKWLVQISPQTNGRTRTKIQILWV